MFYAHFRTFTKKYFLTLSPTLLFFVQKMLSAFYACCIYSNALQIRFFFMESNIMSRVHPRSETKEWSNLGPYCWQYRLPKNIADERGT